MEDKYLSISDKELYHVFKVADNLLPGETIIIAEKAPNRPQIYTECLRRWIDCFKHGEFNGDYSVFRKLSDPKEFLDPKIKPDWWGMMMKTIFNK